jgi:NAD(P)-dependent dehydrogenase (short-subunit alcohol dehydrogenase family)
MSNTDAAATVLIVGASRGLGLGLAKELHSRGANIIATARDPAQASSLNALAGRGRVRIEQLDIDDDAAVAGFPARLAGETLDVLFLNAGIMGPAHQSAQQVSQAEMGALVFTNAIAPIRLARGLAPLVADGHGVIAFMSSILGSVAQNSAGGSELYRASKAALNSLTRGFAVEMRDRHITVLSLHPGWVRTGMGGERAPLDVETSVRGLANVLAKAAGAGTHRFLDYTGAEIAW